MITPLPAIEQVRKDGSEPIHTSGVPLRYTLGDFWAWSTSDLVSNVTRGRFAEFLVAAALGIDLSGVRAEWDSYDLITSSGVRIEVKSAAYLQSWSQSTFSKILWRIPRTRAWDPFTNTYASEPVRQADVYVFALLHHKDKATLDPLDTSQWSFFVVDASVVDAKAPTQSSISLASLRNMVGDPVSFSALSGKIP